MVSAMAPNSGTAGWRRVAETKTEHGPGHDSGTHQPENIRNARTREDELPYRPQQQDDGHDLQHLR